MSQDIIESQEIDNELETEQEITYEDCQQQNSLKQEQQQVMRQQLSEDSENLSEILTDDDEDDQEEYYYYKMKKNKKEIKQHSQNEYKEDNYQQQNQSDNPNENEDNSSSHCNSSQDDDDSSNRNHELSIQKNNKYNRIPIENRLQEDSESDINQSYQENQLNNNQSNMVDQSNRNSQQDQNGIENNIHNNQQPSANKPGQNDYYITKVIGEKYEKKERFYKVLWNNGETSIEKVYILKDYQNLKDEYELQVKQYLDQVHIDRINQREQVEVFSKRKKKISLESLKKKISTLNKRRYIAKKLSQQAKLENGESLEDNKIPKYSRLGKKQPGRQKNKELKELVESCDHIIEMDRVSTRLRIQNKQTQNQSNKNESQLSNNNETKNKLCLKNQNIIQTDEDKQQRQLDSLQNSNQVLQNQKDSIPDVNEEKQNNKDNDEMERNSLIQQGQDPVDQESQQNIRIGKNIKKLNSTLSKKIKNVHWKTKLKQQRLQQQEINKIDKKVQNNVNILEDDKELEQPIQNITQQNGQKGIKKLHWKQLQKLQREQEYQNNKENDNKSQENIENQELSQNNNLKTYKIHWKKLLKLQRLQREEEQNNKQTIYGNQEIIMNKESGQPSDQIIPNHIIHQSGKKLHWKQLLKLQKLQQQQPLIQNDNNFEQNTLYKTKKIHWKRQLKLQRQQQEEQNNENNIYNNIKQEILDEQHQSLQNKNNKCNKKTKKLHWKQQIKLDRLQQQEKQQESVICGDQQVQNQKINPIRNQQKENQNNRRNKSNISIQPPEMMTLRKHSKTNSNIPSSQCIKDSNMNNNKIKKVSGNNKKYQQNNNKNDKDKEYELEICLNDNLFEYDQNDRILI